MSRYLLSPAGQIDLEQIWDYTCHRWDVEQAGEYLRELQGAIERAAPNPRIGRACDEIYAPLGEIAAPPPPHTTVDALLDQLPDVRSPSGAGRSPSCSGPPTSPSCADRTDRWHGHAPNRPGR